MAKTGKASVRKRAMSDEAVKRATGKAWTQWFAVLDKEKASKLPHRAIAELLHYKHKVPGWWCQMVAVEYERARGLRAVHQQTGGYSVSVSKTVGVALPSLYRMIADEKRRATWFPKGALKISSQTKDKYFRGAWGKDGARIEINFYAKSAAKAQIAVQVNKMKRAGDVEKERARWKKALEALQARLG